MPRPVFEYGDYGNVIYDVTLKPGTTFAAFIDISNCVEGQFVVATMTNGAIPKSGATFSFHKIVGKPRQLRNSVIVGSTILQLDDVRGIHANEEILICQSGNTHNQGEIVTVTSLGTDNITVNISPVQYAYKPQDVVCLITQTPSTPVTPGSVTGKYEANRVYSRDVFFGTAAWCLLVTGNDVEVTIATTLDKLTGYS